MDLLASMTLPQGFVQDPANFLTLIASRPTSPDRLSLLAGPLAKWFKDAEVSSSSSPANHVAHLYLCAAAKQLGDSPSPQSVASIPASAASGVLASVAMTTDKNRAKHLQETLEGVIAAALLCPDRSAIGTSGILPVLANLVRATSHSHPVASAMASSIASSISNLPSSSSTAFPPLTLVHTAFLQCAVLAQEYEATETVIRGTWPVPTSALKKQKGRIRDEDHVAISIIMRYYYLRGIIHYECGRDQYALAHRCWWTCLSIPVEVVSKTAIEAWKKLTLVQPLLDIDREGTKQSKADMVDANNDGESIGIFAASSRKKTAARPETRLPKCMPKGLSKSIYALIEGEASTKHQGSSEAGTEERSSSLLSSVYAHLGPAVEAVDRKAVENLLLSHESKLSADGNMGMANNCLKRVKDLQVKKASKMFSVTSIPILARRWNVTPEEASLQLSDAIASGVVPCRLEADGGVVFANDESEAVHSGQALTDLKAWMALLEKLQHMDVDLTVSSKYLKGKEDKSGPSGPRGVEEFYSDP